MISVCTSIIPVAGVNIPDEEIYFDASCAEDVALREATVTSG
jgi:hypothetical protein